MTGLTAEERSERQRLYVKRSYYRAISNIQNLRKQVNELESRYKRMERQLQNVGPQFPISESDIKIIDYQAQNGSLYEAYTTLSILKERLRDENLKYQQLVKDYQKYHKTIQRGITEINRKPEEIPLTSIPGIPNMKQLMQVEDACALAIQSYKEITDFHNIKKKNGIGSLFGWSNEWVEKDGQYVVSLKKIIPNTSPVDTVHDHWSPERAAEFDRSLFHPSMNVQVHLLQAVDDDNAVIYRIIYDPQTKVAVKSLLISQRFQIPEKRSYLISSRSIDHQKYLDGLDLLPTSFEDVKHQVWRPVHGWGMYQECGEYFQDCMVEIGTAIPGTYEQHNNGLRSMMLNYLYLALRIETFIWGGPRSIIY